MVAQRKEGLLLLRHDAMRVETVLLGGTRRSSGYPRCQKLRRTIGTGSGMKSGEGRREGPGKLPSSGAARAKKNAFDSNRATADDLAEQDKKENEEEKKKKKRGGVRLVTIHKDEAVRRCQRDLSEHGLGQGRSRSG